MSDLIKSGYDIYLFTLFYIYIFNCIYYAINSSNFNFVSNNKSVFNILQPNKDTLGRD